MCNRNIAQIYFLRLPLLLPSLLLFLTACTDRIQPDMPLTEQRIPVTIGSATIDVVLHESQRPGLTFVNMHDNENTSVEAVLALLPEVGGRLIHLSHTGERNVSFELEGETYVFDPNRIFTDHGAEATLRDLGPYSDAAHAAVRTFARTILGHYGLDQVEVLVALHNNTHLNYSMLSYGEAGDYASDAASVHLVDTVDVDDFFFVTEASLFEQIKAGGYNVVLQDNAEVTDDGSLSVYCGQHGIAYVNVEAEHGHVAEQEQMIAFLRDLLMGDPVGQ